MPGTHRGPGTRREIMPPEHPGSASASDHVCQGKQAPGVLSQPPIGEIVSLPAAGGMVALPASGGMVALPASGGMVALPASGGMVALPAAGGKGPRLAPGGLDTAEAAVAGLGALLA